MVKPHTSYHWAMVPIYAVLQLAALASGFLLGTIFAMFVVAQGTRTSI